MGTGLGGVGRPWSMEASPVFSTFLATSYAVKGDIEGPFAGTFSGIDLFPFSFVLC